MPYTTPTVDEFLTLFPEFEGQDEQIEARLAISATQIDQSWLESDYQQAVMLLTAHYLSAGEVAAAGGRGIASERIGPLAVSYFQTKSADGWFGSTGYGEQLMDLARGNFPGVMVI